MPIFLLTFHSFAKQKSPGVGGQMLGEGVGSTDSALPPKSSTANLAHCHSWRLWERRMSVECLHLKSKEFIPYATDSLRSRKHFSMVSEWNSLSLPAALQA